jgi:alpha-galactosidase/6-phospho-beta-glucosidase family protein
VKLTCKEPEGYFLRDEVIASSLCCNHEQWLQVFQQSKRQLLEPLLSHLEEEEEEEEEKNRERKGSLTSGKKKEKKNENNAKNNKFGIPARTDSNWPGGAFSR